MSNTTRSVSYVHLQPGGKLPALAMPAKYKAVLVIEAPVSADWQWEVSQWIVVTGCRYMMAWGQYCSSWDDSVAYASVQRSIDREQSATDSGNSTTDLDENFVMTTWHEGEVLEEVFEYSKIYAAHPVLTLGETIILHIAMQERREEMLMLCKTV